MSKNTIALAFFHEQLSEEQRQALLDSYDEPKNIKQQNALEFIVDHLLVFNESAGEIKAEARVGWIDALNEHVDIAGERRYFYFNEPVFAF